MNRLLRTVGIVVIVSLIAVLPVLHYRAHYAHRKRLRVVTPGLVYRSGQMTANGFKEAVERFGIRTIINLQDEYPNPDLPQSYFNRKTIAERELCRKLGVKYVHIAPDLLGPSEVPGDRPYAIDQFLSVMDNHQNFPVLIHCRAGLHRTGCLVAVYRMTYEGWSTESAFAELKGHGFGDRHCTSANEYVRQYVLHYDPKWQRSVLPHDAATAADASRGYCSSCGR